MSRTYLQVATKEMERVEKQASALKKDLLDLYQFSVSHLSFLLFPTSYLAICFVQIAKQALDIALKIRC